MAAKKPATAKVAKNSNRGSKPGERRGGRKKGSLNKKNAAVVAAVVEGGITPLDYMLQVMRDPGADENRRDDMARTAAPYVHPKLAAVEHTGKGGGPMEMHWTVKVVHPGKRAQA